MRILVAGASGVIGRQLVPLLDAAGHEVIALSRSPRVTSGVRWVAAADALDRQARDASGTLNVVDDTPPPMREWLAALAEMLGAPQPRRAPAALARRAVGGWGVAFMTRLRGADNARAKARLDWHPHYASWREAVAR